MAFLGGLKLTFLAIFFFGYIFLVSGVIINFLQLCSCLLWPFNKELFRKINCYLALGLWSQITFLAQCWSKADCVLYIRPEDLRRISKENILVIMNHKYDIDWLVAWLACQRLNMLKGSKIVGKQSLRFAPILGWCWACTETIFVKRIWEQDRITLTTDLQRTLQNYPNNYFFNLLLSCEGTRFTENKRLISMKVAREKGLPELKHHILPRTKGFTLLIQGAHNRFDAVYDITVGFKKTGAPPTFFSILKGNSCQAEMFIRRFPIEEVPIDDDKSSNWIHKLYKEKDDIFDYFDKHDTFDGNGLPRMKIPCNYYDLWIELAWITTIGLPSIIYLFGFLLTSSIASKILLGIIFLLGTIGIRKIIALTETERGSHYGENSED